MGKSCAVFSVDGYVEACFVDLHRDVDRDVEHVWPSRQHVFFLPQRCKTNRTKPNHTGAGRVRIIHGSSESSIIYSSIFHPIQVTRSIHLVGDLINIEFVRSIY